MTYYIIGYAITIFFCIASQKVKRSIYKTVFRILSGLPFMLIAGLRGASVGIDTNLNYIPMYNIAVNYGANIDFFEFYSVKYTFGFTAIIYVLSRFFWQPSFLFLFCSIIIIGFTFYTIYSESQIPWLGITVFFLSGDFVLTMNGMRGYIAIALILYSLRFVKSRQLIKFMFFVFLAGSIHGATLMFVVLYPIYNIRVKKIHVMAGFLAMPFLMLFGSHALSIILKNTSFINYFDASSVEINPLYTMLAINTLIFGFFYLNYKYYRDDMEYNLYLKLQLLSVTVCSFSFVLTHAFRLEQLVDYFQIISIPYNLSLFWNIKTKAVANKRCVLLMIVAIFSLYFIKVFILADDNQVRDYLTIFAGR
jgi:transmembrane protein EpsG|nr:EpsG family protein [uncultured Acetatifactor sp.]